MDTTSTSYDPRFLAGIVLFNRGDFFEAHEVWEDLWMETGGGPEKRFIQGLIQAAVGLCHFCNGNVRGAVKLYHSSRDYMTRNDAPYLGLDTATFWQQMQCCFAELLASPDPDRHTAVNEDLMPVITLVPAPEHWPDPAEFLPEDDSEAPQA